MCVNDRFVDILLFQCMPVLTGGHPPFAYIRRDVEVWLGDTAYLAASTKKATGTVCIQNSYDGCERHRDN